MSPALYLNETIRVDNNNVTDNECMVTSKRKNHAKKKHSIGDSKLCWSTFSAIDTHIGAKQIMGEHSLSGLDGVIKRYNTTNDWSTVALRKVQKQNETLSSDAKPDCRHEQIVGKETSKTNHDEMSVISHKSRESSNTKPKARFKHYLGHTKSLISKLYPGVSIHKFCRVGKITDSESTQKFHLIGETQKKTRRS